MMGIVGTKMKDEDPKRISSLLEHILYKREKRELAHDTCGYVLDLIARFCELKLAYQDKLEYITEGSCRFSGVPSIEMKWVCFYNSWVAKMGDDVITVYSNGEWLIEMSIRGGVAKGTEAGKDDAMRRAVYVYGAMTGTIQ
jgi:hypothetical protein